MPESEATLVSDAYDDCISYLDSQIGKLMDELESRGLLKNTLVVITSDHGEELGEHGLFGHGRSLYSQEVHVPLVILAPWERGDRSGCRRTGQSARPAGDVCRPAGLRPRFAVSGEVTGTLLDVRSRDSLARAPSPAFSEVALRDKVSKNPNRAPAWRGPMQSVVADGRAVHSQCRRPR